LRYLRFSILIAIALAGVLFGVSNQQNATVHFFWYFARTYPLYLVLFASFFTGTLASIVYGIIADSDLKHNERRLERQIKELTELVKKSQKARAQAQTPQNMNEPGFF
jgi:uncharacterized integral membrane protein